MGRRPLDIVGDWGQHVRAENWLHAVRGADAAGVPANPIPFSEVLEAMLRKFVGKIRECGFRTCHHIAGTWQVAVSWDPLVTS